MNADGGYDLAYNADGSVPEETVETVKTEEPEITTYTDPNTGAEWKLGADGEWTTEFNYDDYNNYPETDSSENTDYTDFTKFTDNPNYTLTDNENYDEQLDYVKKGGLW